MKHGLVFGKFLPPHLGHVHLIEEARKRCTKLTVLVCSLKREPIPGELRHYWMTQIFPDLEIVHVTDEVPQYPHEHPDFWNIWINIIRKNTTDDLDCIFSSEDYGFELATRMGIYSMLIDKERKEVPISGTLIRSNPYKYWKYIPSVVRPYYMKKVVLTGPESVGKTFTSEYLANKFNTLWVPEYGREYCEEKSKITKREASESLGILDFSHIASGQLIKEQSTMMRAAEKSQLIICDTDLIVTQIWSQIFLGKCPEWIAQYNRHHHYDLYLLMNTDIPWINDGTREFGNIRQWHFDRIERELKERRLNYVVISGNYEERLNRAEEVITSLIKNTA
jgi:HTH-type transcriptional repressor of NAD biosynthesis genes